MNFVSRVGAGAVLVALTLSLQCAGLTALIQWARAFFAQGMYRLGPLRSALLMVRLTGLIIGLHMAQILLWAGFYRATCIPSWESAFYFSTASYSTVGSGDVLLPQMWRSLGAVESITGVLMCALSASFLFAIVMRLVEREARFAPVLPRGSGDRGQAPVHSGAGQWTEREIRH
jgi:voltage-gated potassium channel